MQKRKRKKNWKRSENKAAAEGAEEEGITEVREDANFDRREEGISDRDQGMFSKMIVEI